MMMMMMIYSGRQTDVRSFILLLSALRKGHLIGVEFDTIGMRMTGTLCSVRRRT
jgi:hypothetical protein